ncbi:MAG: hypothetical protein JW910_06210 [Anaerolineae bacterium]|nr:hypothetical protein [Anaerolineae bacterium]
MEESTPTLGAVRAAIDAGDFQAAYRLLTPFLQDNPDDAEAMALLEQVSANLPSTAAPAAEPPASDAPPNTSRWSSLREQATRKAASAGENLRKAGENLQSNEAVQNYRSKIAEASDSAVQRVSRAGANLQANIQENAPGYAERVSQGVSTAAAQARQRVTEVQASEAMQNASRTVRGAASGAAEATRKAAVATSTATSRLVILLAGLYFLFVLGIPNLCINLTFFAVGNFFSAVTAEVETQLASATGEIARLQAEVEQGIALSPAEEAMLREFVNAASASVDTPVPDFLLSLFSLGNPLTTVTTLSRLAVIWGILGIALSVAATVTAIGLLRRMAWTYRGAIAVGLFHIGVVLFTVVTGFPLEPLRTLAILISAGIVVAFFFLPGMRNTLQSQTA